VEEVFGFINHNMPIFVPVLHEIWDMIIQQCLEVL